MASSGTKFALAAGALVILGGGIAAALSLSGSPNNPAVPVSRTSTTSNSTTATTVSLPSLSAESVTLAEDMTKGDFAAVRAHFDNTMEAGLSETQLAAGWQQVTATLGSYRTHGQPIAKNAGNEIIFVPMVFSDASFEVQFSFDADGRIGGFYLRPAGFDQSVP
ncbi:MAG TPA: DUF3887 domain-containing protein [Acidimicrobiales bacterium]|nr:DUF3887 domain-containing protein [Acidimicrobiales bacterium]